MSHSHFTSFDRTRIEEGLSFGLSSRQLGKRLHRSHTSISREVNRNSFNGIYRAEIAHALYETRKGNCGAKGKYSAELACLIADKILTKWSPEQITNTVAKDTVSFKTIYTWILENRIPGVSPEDLRHKGKRCKQEKRGVFSNGVSIHDRPESVKDRKEFGHWELDSVVSSRGKSKGCVATFLERKTRFYVAIKMANRTAGSMFAAFGKLYGSLPEGAMLTATTDRGKEFACHELVKQHYGITFYFADAYCSWQRGANENSNGLLREYFPKKTDFAKVSAYELSESLYELNSRPRKCLGWISPIDAFLQEVVRLNC